MKADWSTETLGKLATQWFTQQREKAWTHIIYTCVLLTRTPVKPGIRISGAVNALINKCASCIPSASDWDAGRKTTFMPPISMSPLLRVERYQNKGTTLRREDQHTSREKTNARPEGRM